MFDALGSMDASDLRDLLVIVGDNAHAGRGIAEPEALVERVLRRSMCSRG